LELQVADSAFWNVKLIKTVLKVTAPLGIGCTSCDCHENGTIGGACDTTTGQCVCHEEVEGFKCDMCKEDFYGLNTLGHCTGDSCNRFFLL
jgi:hypothetical protein